VLDQNVTPAEAQAKPDHFAAIAASLRAAADGIETLVGSGLPKPNHFQLNIQPGGRGDDDLTRRSVDALTVALLGHPGRLQEMSKGGYYFTNGSGDEALGAIRARLYQSVSTEWALKREQAAELAEREAERAAELAALRARIAELEASTDRPASDRPILSAVLPTTHDLGFGYSREVEDDPTPVSPARGPLHIGAVTDNSLVPKPIAQHYESGGWKGASPGTSGVECACGVTYDGFDSLAEAADQLARHIEAGNAETAPGDCTCWATSPNGCPQHAVSVAH
jgi:hypothetical protein